MKKDSKSRDQLISELRNRVRAGSEHPDLVATTGHSYGSIHSMLRESGTADAQPRRAQPPRPALRLTAGAPTPRRGPARR